jgi:hypothetical protein
MYNVVHSSDIQAASGNVRGQEQTARGGGKLVQVFQTLRLLHVTVQR